MPRHQSYIADAFSYGFIPERRVLYATGYVDDAFSDRLQIGLELLSQSDKPITIYLDSQGGYIYSGFAIYDAIKACPCPVTIIGRGIVFSMATVILQAADKRYLTPHTTVMVHQARGGVDEDRLDNMKLSAKELERLDRLTAEILSVKMEMSLKAFKEKFALDRYFTAGQAVAAGLADAVL